MWVYSDSTREFLAVNEAAIRRYGYTRAESLAMKRHDLRVQPEPPQPTARAMSTGGGGTAPWNGQHRKKDGSVINVAVTSHPITFNGREACLALALDVTGPKRAAEALRQSEQRTRLIIDTALDAVISMTLVRSNIGLERAGGEDVGWSRAEAIGTANVGHDYSSPLSRRPQQGAEKFLATGEGPVLNQRIEITALGRDGREFPVELAISPRRWVTSGPSALSSAIPASRKRSRRRRSSGSSVIARCSRTYRLGSTGVS